MQENSMSSTASSSSDPKGMIRMKSTEVQAIGRLGEKYILIKKLGKGGTASVYLGCDKENINNLTKDNLYAFKIIKNTSSTILNSEHSVLKSVQNENIIKSYDYEENVFLIKTKKNRPSESKKVNYLRLEYLKFGELFDFVYYPKRGFGENMGRLIFKSILNGLLSLYSSGYVHRDIKPENIMVDSDYNIKISDFGFASQNEGIMINNLGTLGYACPENANKQPYYGIANDVFSLGITIFVLVTGSMPFRYSSVKDPFYFHIANGNYENFWSIWLKRGIRLSKSFQNMINVMVAYDYSQRPSIEEILACEWVKEGDFSQANYTLLKEEMKSRAKIVYCKKSSEKKF